MEPLIAIRSGAEILLRCKPVTVAKARKLYQRRLDIRTGHVAVMNNKRVHGNTKLKPGDVLAFIQTHGTIG